MKNIHAIDEARLTLMLNELRLTTIKTLWPQFAEQADTQHWAEKVLSLSNERWLKRALGAARKRDRSSTADISLTEADFAGRLSERLARLAGFPV